MIDLRNVVINAVLGGSAVAAVWLSQEPGPLAAAPAHVLAQEFKLSPVETGRLAAVLVAPGQRVTGGQVLARVDTAVLEREIAVAEARLRQFGSETQASTVALETEGYQSERSFRTDVEEASIHLEAAKAAQAQSTAELKQTREELSRQKQHLREGLIRRDRVDELELRTKTLENALAEWPARIDSLDERVHAARTRLNEWRTRYATGSAAAPRLARVQPVRQRVAEQVEALRVLKARLASADIVAPADGEVVTVLAQQGDVVRSGDHFIVLNGAGARHVVAYVNEREDRVPQPGQPARLQRRTLMREQYSSRVIRVADTVVALPARFWKTPQLAVYGREVVLEVPNNSRLDTGEALEVTFLQGGAL